MQNSTSSDCSSGSGSSSSNSSVSARDMALIGQGSGVLPTLHEGEELVTDSMSQQLQSNTPQPSSNYSF